MNDEAILNQHLTRLNYTSSRVDLLNLIQRKITYKERLVQRFDAEFSEQLHKSITTVEGEVNTLLAFVQAFDRMADLLQQEADQAATNYQKANRKNAALFQLLNYENERVQTWSETAFKLADDHAKSKITPKPLANA